jgi:hypothetical protein
MQAWKRKTAERRKKANRKTHTAKGFPRRANKKGESKSN